MKLTIDIPLSVEQSLQQQLGAGLAQAAKEALAIAWYREERLSIGQVSELLGISVYESEGLMKRHGVDAPYSVEDFDADRKTLKQALDT